jgi:hypothetical protein
MVTQNYRQMGCDGSFLGIIWSLLIHTLDVNVNKANHRFFRHRQIMIWPSLYAKSIVKIKLKQW